jgi:hypothetical protein
MTRLYCNLLPPSEIRAFNPSLLGFDVWFRPISSSLAGNGKSRIIWIIADSVLYFVAKTFPEVVD